MSPMRLALLASALLTSLVGAAQAQTTLRIGIAEDPDILDPSIGRTYVGRIVFSAFCDKLFDIDEKLNIVPQLALSHETSPDGKEMTIKLPAQREIPRRRAARRGSRKVLDRASHDAADLVPQV
ncbi:ABC-type transport system substrate-binding protein [Bradyrhizobium sp. USDA 3051]